MSSAMIVPILIGFGVIVVVAAVAMIASKSTGEVAEGRLDEVTRGVPRPGRDEAKATTNLLKATPFDPEGSSRWRNLLPKFDDLGKLYEQADVAMPFDRFMIIVGGLSIAGLVAGLVAGLPRFVIPLAVVMLGGSPILWLVRRKKKRIRDFVAAMPEAVELMSRALRAGHGLASGMNLVAEEMNGPIAEEFGRVFYEQNLGVPVEAALRGLAERVPSMDVRFFVTAVVIQRGTGGDLAEVLEKIGRLIRQRYELFGHVKSLTAEGRLSGIVLLALPPALLGFLAFTNFNYVSPLFSTPNGSKMLAITAALQVVGALCIKKIVAIKV